MRVSSFRNGDYESWGIVSGDHVADVGAVLADRFADIRTAIAGDALNEAGDAAGEADQIPIADIEWMPVIPTPDKILCVGLNYEMHRLETKRAEVKFPTIFGRYANSQTGHECDILRPRVSTRLDYEGELAVIIGKTGRYISKETAWDYIAGYSCYNDGSIRDYQRHTHQFTPGKNFPQTGALGPSLVTPDEVGAIAGQRIQTRVNGLVVQDATLDQMIFDVPTIIQYCSEFTRLEPGDVIATGTPGGVGDKRDPQLWLKPGDLVEVEIEGVGHLKNGVVDEG